MERIYVHPSRRFLMTESGAPFFWLGDTAWELFHRLTREDAAHYLDNRRERGFNVIQAMALAEFDGLNVPNAYGHLPLIDHDPRQPNEDYFRFVDEVLDMAAARGLYVGLLPTWGDKVNLAWGKGPVVFDPAAARAYGEFLGRRWRERANLLWILGGDRDEITSEGVDVAPVWRAMAEGIRAGVGGHTFMTYHPCGGRGSSMAFHNDDWLDMNMWQSGHLQPDQPNWEMIGSDYARTPVKPVLDGEPNYEDHPVNPFTRQWHPHYGRFSDHDVRKQAYRAVFAGACGHTYGHHAVWQFYDETRQPVNFPLWPWREAILRPGAAQLTHLAALIQSRPCWTRIPDQALLASDPGTGADHVQAARASDGAYAFVYIPNANQSVTLHMDALSGDAGTAYWYDPRSGQAHTIGKTENYGPRTFTTPLGGPDWVLVLDDADHEFPPPGQGS